MASMATLTDDFSAGTLNTSLWAIAGDGITFASGAASLNALNTTYRFAGFSSNSAYDLTNTAAWVQIIGIPASDSKPPQASFNLSQYFLSGGFGDVGWNYDYTTASWAVVDFAGEPRAHAPAGGAIWLRIRNSGGSGGSMLWDYSSNGNTWINAYTTSMAALTSLNFGTPVTLTALYYNTYVSRGNTNGALVFDNVNVTPPASLSSGGFVLFL